jgi:hypothetical protein
MYTGTINSKVDGQQHRRININASKDSPYQGTKALKMVSTILRACPLGDTIAILIVLLQIPSTFLMIIHCLFAALTFVTPSGPIASLPSIADFLQSSTGTPSLATTVAADILSLLVWFCLWTPAQNFAIDLAQAVVAIALGGGYNQDDGSKTAGVCFLIIAASHIADRKGIRQAGLSTSRNGGSSMPVPSDILNTTRNYSQWMRNLLAIHIFTQGLVRWVRRYIYRREMDNAEGSSKKVDPEAAAGRDQHDEDSSNRDSIQSLPGLPSIEASPTLPNQGAKDGKEKASSGKRRKKQGLLVRSQQPLWAALASTKVVVLKEYEQTQASREASVSKSIKIDSPGETRFDSEQSRVWITHVGSTDLKFSTSSFDTRESTLDNCDTNGFITTGVDKSKPFYLRINTAEWASTRICKVLGSDKSFAGPGSEWTGEVFGLTTLTSYLIEFVRSVDDAVIYETNLMTQSSNASEQGRIDTQVFEPILTNVTASSMPSPTTVIPPSLRPSSPTTTLRNSILSAEVKLAEDRNRLKRLRKEHTKSLQTLKSEQDKQTQKLSSSGTGDDKLRSRVMQTKQQIRQAEDAITATSSRIDALGSIPEEDVRSWKSKRAAWENECATQESVSNSLDDTRHQLATHFTNIQLEAQSAHKNRERLQNRQVKLNEQRDRLISANAAGVSEFQRRQSESALKDNDRARYESQCLDQTQYWENAVQETNFRTTKIWSQIRSWEDAFMVQQAQQQQQAAQRQQQLAFPPGSPLTPEGTLPGTNVNDMSSSSIEASHHQAPSYPFPPFNQGLTTLPSKPSPLAAHKEPAMTMPTTGNSLYDEDEDEDPAPPMPGSSSTHFPWTTSTVREHRTSSTNGSASESFGKRTPAAKTSPVQRISPVSGSIAGPSIWATGNS